MKAAEFWKAVTVDRSNLLERVLDLLREHQIRYCVIGGQGVNAYVEPVVSLDLDLVVAVEQLDHVEQLLSSAFRVRRFPHSLNISLADSDLRVQIQTDDRYADFLTDVTVKQVLGHDLPVASIEDVLKGKIWAASDPDRRASKRQKDLADIARLIEARPDLRANVPREILARLL